MKNLAIWITGLPGSGKSVLADGIKERFPDFVILRMDELREIATPMPTYSETERSILYGALVFTAKKIYSLGHSIIIDATGNLRLYRNLAKNLLPEFAEIYLKCPINICAEREAGRTERRHAPANIYKKAKAGWPVPGISAPYEEPLNPDLVIDTSQKNIEEAAKEIFEFIKERGFA